jgi:diaminopimelate epimerase
MLSEQEGIAYFKMHGSGNDFVLIDNRVAALPPESMQAWAEPVCARRFGVGADGIIFLDPAPPGNEADYVWHFFNSDGSRPEMCGNGARCAAKLAYEAGLAGERQILGTDAGPVRTHVMPEIDEVKVEMNRPFGLELEIPLEVEASPITVHFVNLGVPHAVVFGNDIESVDVLGLGRDLRRHGHFAPAGANVNFAQVLDQENMLLRTYERGVEDETFACGTGASAAAYISRALGFSGEEVEVKTSGGEILHISMQGDTVFLQGRTVLVAKGTLFPAALGL